MQKIALIGSEGSIGKRYKSILKYLNLEYEGFDKELPPYKIKERVMHDDFSHIILATPTNDHYNWLSWLIEFGCKHRVLCEKPVTKDMHQMMLITNSSLDLTMVYQYKYVDLQPTSLEPNSYYRFYNHGADGLAWDCIQLIGLAEGNVEIKEDTPIWSMMINGNEVIRSSVDTSYVRLIEAWLKGEEKQSKWWLYDLHKRCHDLQKRVVTENGHKSLNWNPSENQ